MKPLSQFSLEARRNVRVLLTDIDDTMTRHGALPSKSLRALEELRQSGVITVPVTGRPGGWCDHIARMWPVDAVVGENGALFFSYDRGEKKMRRYFTKSRAERNQDREQLEILRERILTEFPEVGVASDQDYRVADLAIDYCEDVPPVAMDKVVQIVDFLERNGATTKVSSIHINAWLGNYDKLATTRRCLHDLFGIDAEKANETIVFVGDSPNDEPMFAFFRHSVGVANVKNFALKDQPTWVTAGEGATGFCEIATAIVTARKEM